MSQLDFFVIPKLTIIVVSSLAFVFVGLVFWAILRRFFYGVVVLCYKAILIKENAFIRRSLSNVSAGFVFILESDLLEQFIIIFPFLKNIAIYVGILFYIFTFVFIVFNYLIRGAANFSLVTIKDVVGDSYAKLLLGWPVLTAVFILVTIVNLVGLLPLSYTLTGSLAAPFYISFAVFFTYLFILVSNFGLTFFAGFLPTGTNIFIAPLIAIIEVISTIAKFISLGVRLFANMFAGHLLLKVFYTISFQLVNALSLFLLFGHVFVFAFLIFITSLETLIAILQAFVWLLLTTIYLKEADSFINAH